MTSERSATKPQGFDAVTAARAALDVLVFAPLGLGAKMVDDAPTALRLARQELSNARFIGRMALGQGVAQMRTRPKPGASESAPSPSSDDDRLDESEVDDGSLGEEMVTVVPVVEDLALPDYDHLPAIDIVAKLGALSPDELDSIAAYESVNRQRRTVLGKLQQLSESL